MKTIERKVYYCEFCIYLKKDRVANGVDEDDVPRSKTEFTCTKTGKKLYSVLAEKKGIVHLLKDVERMPLECDLYSMFKEDFDDDDPNFM